jgi:hypothetical protein
MNAGNMDLEKSPEELITEECRGLLEDIACQWTDPYFLVIRDYTMNALDQQWRNCFSEGETLEDPVVVMADDHGLTTEETKMERRRK